MKYLYVIQKDKLKKRRLLSHSRKKASTKIVKKYVEKYGWSEAISLLIREGFTTIPTPIGIFKLQYVYHNGRELYVPTVVFKDEIIKAIASLQYQVKIKEDT